VRRRLAMARAGLRGIRSEVKAVRRELYSFASSEDLSFWRENSSAREMASSLLEASSQWHGKEGVCGGGGESVGLGTRSAGGEEVSSIEERDQSRLLAHQLARLESLVLQVRSLNIFRLSRKVCALWLVRRLLPCLPFLYLLHLFLPRFLGPCPKLPSSTLAPALAPSNFLSPGKPR
jgi:hypothetical protein